MLSKKIKLLFTSFVAITLITTMCFATDAEPAETNTEEPVAVTSSEEEPEVTTSDGDSDLPADSADDTTGATDTIVPLEGDIYRASTDDIEISDAVNGNIFVASKGTVTISGQVAGDLFVAADSVNIDGAQIYGNVFAIANNITLNGLIYDLYGVCGHLEIPYNGTTYRDLKVVCKSAVLDGVVGGNVNITVADSLELQDDCIIYKDLNYTSEKEFTLNTELVQGNINYSKSAANTNINIAPNYGIILVMLLVFVLIVWAVITFLAPNFNEKIQNAGKVRPIASLLYGLLGLIVVPIASVLLMLTVVGVPVALIAFGLYCLVISITCVLTSISLANILAEKVAFFAKAKKVLAVLLVAVVLYLLTLVPYVGGLVYALSTIYGFGMFVLAVLNKVNKKEKTDKE